MMYFLFESLAQVDAVCMFTFCVLYIMDLVICVRSHVVTLQLWSYCSSSSFCFTVLLYCMFLLCA